MLNMFEVIETNNMIEHEKLDVRTITMGISLLIAVIPIWRLSIRKFTIKLFLKRKIWFLPVKRFPGILGFRLSINEFL